MTADLPYDLFDEERMLVEVLDAIAVERVAAACAEADERGRLEPGLATLLHEQGLLLAGVPEVAEELVRPLLGVLVVERLARAGAAAAGLVAGAHDAAAAFEGRARERLSAAETATLADGTGGAVTATADGSRWILQGRVSRVELPDAAQTLVVLAGTDDGGEAAFAVERHAEGVGLGDREPTTGMRGLPVAAIDFDDCAARDDQRVAGPAGVSAARAHRAVSSAALCVGIGAGAHAVAAAYADERRQFGQTLRGFPAVAGMLLDIETRVAAAAALMWTAARWLERPGAEAESVARRAASDAAAAVRFATRAAVQVHGGYGYIREQVVERYMRDAISAAARAGGTELVRLASAPAGAVECGPVRLA